MAAVDIYLGKDSYTVEIRRGLLEDTGRKIRRLTDAEKIAVVTDDHVGPLYGDRFRKILEDAGFTVRIITIPAGETSKNLSVFGDVLNAMADFEMTRKDALVTLSGGVPGDLGGYAAASSLRGIPFFQVPTTILAQIDSSVGGKVAVDLPAGKNLAGAFYQPRGVFIDPDLLSTLPARFIHDGLAEAVKYGCIGDRRLFSLFESGKRSGPGSPYGRHHLCQCAAEGPGGGSGCKRAEYPADTEFRTYHRSCGGEVFPI